MSSSSSSSSSPPTIVDLTLSPPPHERVLTRPCDGAECIKCLDIIRPDKDSGVGLTVPSKKLKTLNRAEKGKLSLSWDLKRRVNYLHEDCWNRFIQGTLSRPDRKIINPVLESLEHYSSFATVQDEVKKLIPLLMKSRRTICFTGSGISASAGLYTYRGAGGIDELEEHAEENDDEEEDDPDWASLQPTFTHHSLEKMRAEMNLLQYVITQNCDNLHQKAGTPPDCISDLHGNLFVEYCEKCMKEYTRPFVTEASDLLGQEKFARRCEDCGWNHYTGRKCSKCKGKLKDTIVNFSDDLHEIVCGGLPKAEQMSDGSDVCICLGTSLSVFPASNLPLKSKYRIIVNLQDTDLDKRSHARVYATSDDFFRVLMPILEEEFRKEKELQQKESGCAERKRSVGANEKRNGKTKRLKTRIIELTE